MLDRIHPFLRRKTKETLLKSSQLAHVVTDPSTGELCLDEHAIPPEVGMYSVLTLKEVRVLVKYLRELPFRSPKREQGDSSYFYVRPLLETLEVKEGMNFTLMVGDRHFLAVIDTLLPLYLPRTPRNDNRILIDPDPADETRGKSIDHLRVDPYPVTPSQPQLTPTPTPAQTPNTKGKDKMLPPPPLTTVAQTRTSAPNTPKSRFSVFNPSPEPSPVIPKMPLKDSTPASRSPKSTSVGQDRKTLDKVLEEEPPRPLAIRRKPVPTQIPVAPEKPQTITVSSTRTPIADYSTLSPDVKKTALQPGDKRDTALRSSPRRVALSVDNKGRPQAHPSPAPTKNINMESSEETIQVDSINGEPLEATGSRQPSQERSPARTPVESRQGSPPKPPASALGLTFKTGNMPPTHPSVEISERVSSKSAGHRRTGSEQCRPDTQPTGPRSGKEKRLSTIAEEQDVRPGSHALITPEATPQGGRTSGLPESPLQRADGIHREERTRRQSLDSGLRPGMSNRGTQLSPSAAARNKILEPASPAQSRPCKECGTPTLAPLPLLGSPSFGVPVDEGKNAVHGMFETDEEDANRRTKDVTHFVWKFSVVDGIPDAFRRLVQERKASNSPAAGSIPGFRGSFAAATAQKKAVDASQPAFKPRNVKKTQESKYRDRASERRTGGGNDYAHIEAIRDDFEKRNADNDDRAKVEAERQYLGGDSEHSILVKGLDFALLEQNKARSALTNDDLDELDQAYNESASKHESAVPKKRTREDLIRELKEQRAAQASSKTAEEEARLLEEAKQMGKFKPIGFKPIGTSADGKKKSKANGADSEKKKRKKRKVEEATKATEAPAPTPSTSAPIPPKTAVAVAPSEPEAPTDDDFDIFAGAGDYEGIAIDDDEEAEEEGGLKARDTSETEQEGHTLVAPRRWIETDEPLPDTKPNIPLPLPSTRPESRSPRPIERGSDNEEEAERRTTRLVPLASSALPSIKDLLAMDQAAQTYEKRKKRKEKKKGGGGGGGDSE
ncbi:hypothetical protein CVT26_014206 [Gymnopilus dilepis]|uniref:RED-like N-terminal domain-containing protein n=1 Tax=Gymnopilus dilepis TaxID=231916 RepID=A0A409VU49_9AGAR|nr:hypothetical protein CVT26_014206 [Gymnopilus dilepis]